MSEILSFLSFLVPALILGLGSSFTHCAGMCGPIHFALLQNPKASPSYYHLGRLLGYTILGYFVSFIGNTPDYFNMGVWKTSVRVLMIAVYVLLGVIFIAKSTELEIWISRIVPFPKAFFAKALRGDRKMIFMAGMAGSTLPCPSVLASLAFVLTLSHPWMGATSMLIFGLATLPFFALISHKVLKPKWFEFRFVQVMLSIYFIGFACFKVVQWIYEPAMANCHCH